MAAGLADALARKNVKLLYYYSPLENVASIMQGGILSRNIVKRDRIPHRDFSLSSAQRRRSMLRIGVRPLHDYAPLFMNAFSPMFEERLRELGNMLARIGVSSHVCDKEGVYFSASNVAYHEGEPVVYSAAEDVEGLPWALIKSTASNNSARGAEILVPERVEVRYFLYVFVTDPNDPAVKSLLPRPSERVTYHRFDSGTVFEGRQSLSRLLEEFRKKISELER